MGREVRRVPVGWEHPRNPKGEFIPLHDRTFEEAVADWEKDRTTYYHGDLVEQLKAGERSPDPAWYRQTWPEDAVLGYAVYETVSEGTPVTPTFATKAELVDYLATKGTYWDNAPWRREAAEQFVADEWAPSFVMVGGAMHEGARDADILAVKGA